MRTVGLVEEKVKQPKPVKPTKPESPAKEPEAPLNDEKEGTGDQENLDQ